MIAAQNNRRQANEKKNWPKIKRIDGQGEGDTIFIGARASEAYGRLYDKYMESGDNYYAACWRYEVEYKGSKARDCARILLEREFTTRSIISMCARQYEEWKFNIPDVEIDAIELPCRDRNDSDTARKLEWLKKQVRPTIEQLFDTGNGSRTVDALFANILDDLRGLV